MVGRVISAHVLANPALTKPSPSTNEALDFLRNTGAVSGVAADALLVKANAPAFGAVMVQPLKRRRAGPWVARLEDTEGETVAGATHGDLLSRASSTIIRADIALLGRKPSESPSASE